jgi:hypothetical protein
MIAPTAHGCKRVAVGGFELACNGAERPPPREICRHGIVSRIIILPNFRLSNALLGCDKQILRWPGPFGTGFLSPQPPGVVRIGPVRKKHTPILGQRELVLFLFGLAPHVARVGIRARPSPGSPCEPPTSLAKQKRRRRSISEGTYRPRPASGPACRDCRPGYRPQRHRRPRGRYFPAARSSSRGCRSSRRPSAGCAPHCSR